MFTHIDTIAIYCIVSLLSVKPFLHQPGMYDIEIKKGRTFRYDLWYGGEPPPTVIWERNGIVLQGSRVEKT